jgi:glycerate kinase
MPRVVLAPDKFRGTADARQVTSAMADAAVGLGWDMTALPMSDGGEGLLDACAEVCPTEVVTRVTGPDGSRVDAAWRFGDGTAVVESARASGLSLAGGARRNDPVAATSRGTGELLVAAARRVGPGGTVVVGLGGSATTDGGLGALEAVEAAGGLGGARLVGACDVAATFVEAAAVFGPQKGAGPDLVVVLTERLEALADRYLDHYGIDVRVLPRAGAAGGLGGALAVLGGTLASGYELVRDLVGLDRSLGGADRVVTGEGALDATSFRGKVVGGVVGDARPAGLATLVVVGRCTAEGLARARDAGCTVVSLVDRFGHRRAQAETGSCIAEVTADWLGPAGTLA